MVLYTEVMSSKYRLLLPTDYVEDLIKTINRSKHRVNLIALTIAEDAQTRQLIDALCRASERGVEVSVAFDLYFTYREMEKTSRHWWAFWNRTQLMRETRKRLSKSGVKVQWLGQFGLFIFFRRTHIKWSVVDDTVYCFGGINIHHTGISNVDYMFKLKDSSLAEELAGEHRRILSADRAGHGYASHLFGTISHTVLIDGGKPNDSIIYRHVLSYALEAEKIIYVSQYCPSSQLARILRQHGDAKLYFNPWRNADDIFNRWLIRWSTYRHGFKNHYRRKKYLHAKFMIFTMPNGKEVAITGSHNFVAGGVLFGTREVALETTDRHIISQLKLFLDKQLET